MKTQIGMLIVFLLSVNCVDATAQATVEFSKFRFFEGSEDGDDKSRWYLISRQEALENPAYFAFVCDSEGAYLSIKKEGYRDESNLSVNTVEIEINSEGQEKGGKKHLAIDLSGVAFLINRYEVSQIFGTLMADEQISAHLYWSEPKEEVIAFVRSANSDGAFERMKSACSWFRQ